GRRGIDGRLREGTTFHPHSRTLGSWRLPGRRWVFVDLARRSRTTRRVFVTYAAISLVPVLALGAILALTYRTEAQRRGLAAGRSEAALVAHVAIEPALDGRPLAEGLSPTELAAMRSIVRSDRSDHSVLRLRLRVLSR